MHFHCIGELDNEDGFLFRIFQLFCHLNHCLYSTTEMSGTRSLCGIIYSFRSFTSRGRLWLVEWTVDIHLVGRHLIKLIPKLMLALFFVAVGRHNTPHHTYDCFSTLRALCLVRKTHHMGQHNMNPSPILRDDQIISVAIVGERIASICFLYIHFTHRAKDTSDDLHQKYFYSTHCITLSLHYFCYPFRTRYGNKRK